MLKKLVAIFSIILSATWQVDAQSCTLTGPDSLCQSASVSLSISAGCTTSYTAYLSTNTTIATVTSSGVVTGVGSGLVAIKACSVSDTLTKYIFIKPLPVLGAITGTFAKCRGTTTVLACTPSGGVWSSSNTTVATISTTGLVRALAYGTTLISYAVTNGCGTVADTVRFKTDTTLPLPSVSTDTLQVCGIGTRDTIRGYPVGGSFGPVSSSYFTVVSQTNYTGYTEAIIRSAFQGGPININYTLGNSCGSHTATTLYWVRDTVRPILGRNSICPGGRALFTDPTFYGTWSSSDSSVASVDAYGYVTAVGAGTARISYTTSGYAACPSGSATFSVTVGHGTHMISPSPFHICEGNSRSLTVSYYGGTFWVDSSGSHLGHARVTGSGSFTGIFADSLSVYYSCGTYVDSATAIIDSIIRPSLAASFTDICSDSTDTLTVHPYGGTLFPTDSIWYRFVDSAGGYARYIVSSRRHYAPDIYSAGTVRIITYTASYGACGTATTSSGSMNVWSPVIAGPVVATRDTVCQGDTVFFSTNGTSGGDWFSADTSLATVDASGRVIAVGSSTIPLTVHIYYHVEGACGGDTAYHDLTILPHADAGIITGSFSACAGTTTTLSTTGAGGGTWSSSSTYVATVDAVGTVTAVNPGTATIYYAITGVCGFGISSFNFMTNPQPVITGRNIVCTGNYTNLTCLGISGLWTSGDISIATVDPMFGYVNGVAPGVVLITFMSDSGCVAEDTIVVTAPPTVSVTPYHLAVIPCGNFITLSATTTGGTGHCNYEWTYFAGPAVDSSITVNTSTIPYHFGTYVFTVTATDSAGCVVTDTVLAVQPSCNICQIHSPSGNYYGVGGDLGTLGTTTTLPDAIYYVYTDARLLGEVQINNQLVAASPSSKITVGAESKLTMKHSHFFCCDTTKKWKGFVSENSGPLNSGRFEITDNSLIEDADTAIKLSQSIINDTPSFLLVCDGVTFNKNKIGISIDNFPDTTVTSYPSVELPFHIGNTVFTSRDLSVYTDSFSGDSYPIAWPLTYGRPTAMKGMHGSISPSIPPYNLIYSGAAGYGRSYKARRMNTGEYADIGILLNKVGRFSETGAAPNCPAEFSYITVGDSSRVHLENLNIFDSLLAGVFARNSNVVALNNAYMYIHPVTSYTGNATGNAILSIGTSSFSAPDYDKFMLNVCGNRGPVSVYRNNNNQFYNCYKGVTTSGIYYNTVDNTDMYNSPGGVHSVNGIYNTTPRYLYTHFCGNSIQNVTAAIINYNPLLGAAAINPQYSGFLDINRNTITNCVTGISAQKTVALRSQALLGAESHIDTNNIYGVRMGILASGFTNQNITTDTNYIELTTSSANEYGIEHTNCAKSAIRNNVVLGQTPPAPDALISYFSRTGQVGYYVSGSSNTTVTCNIAAQLSACYQFIGAGNTSKWLNNVSEDAYVGLVMQGDFGWQYNTPGIFSAGNVWKGAFSGMDSFTILTINSDSPTLLSTIYVTNDSGTRIYDPANNRNQPPYWPFTYGYGSGVGCGLVLADYYAPTCTERTPLNTRYYRAAYSHNAADSMLEYALTNPPYANQALNWQLQNSIYRQLLRDSTLGASSEIIGYFKARAEYNRYGLLAAMEMALNSGDKTLLNSLLNNGNANAIDTVIDTATGVVMTDDPTANEIVQNYLRLYKYHVKYLDTVLTATDSAGLKTLAWGCPYMDGNAVIDARVLYRLVFQDDTTIFGDSCTDATDIANRRYRKLDKTIQQAYELFPNPATDQITVKQKFASAENLEIAIYDQIGQLISDEKVDFIGKYTFSTNNLNNGVYLMVLKGLKGNSTTIKFIKQ